MGIRLITLYISVIGLSIYAWKDWYKSLCGLILLMAVIEHEDMPKLMFGIPGLNPWNVLFGIIVLAWAVNRRREGLRWDMPRHLAILLLTYMSVIAVGVLRAVFDRSHIEAYPFGTRGLISEELINAIKWTLPGLLLFDGCRTRKRVIAALVCLLIMYFLIGVQVVRNVPPRAAIDGGGVMSHSRMKLNKSVGYQATDLSVMLAGASWGIVAALALVRRKKFKAIVLAGAGVVAFGVALTGGRGGYLAWGLTGLILCLVKWRRHLVLVPIMLMLLPVILPGATARMLQGIGVTDVAGESTVDQEALGAGRLTVWPYVIDKISESPLIGYGRLAMKRTGLYEFINMEYPGTGAPHPHNMYLETLLDNGLLGSIPIWLFWGIVVVRSGQLFRSSNRLYSAAGGLALSLVLASLIGGMTGQHLYPQEHTLGIWAALFLSIRVSVEEEQTRVLLDLSHALPDREVAHQQEGIPAMAST